MSKTGKTILGLIVIVVVVLLIVLGVRGKNKTPTSTEPIKIGFAWPLSGDVAFIGENAKAAAEIAVEDINKAGGIDGRPVEIIYEDGKCEGKTAANAASKLVSVDKVVAIISGCSPETLAIAPIATQAKVIVISSGSTAPTITTAGDYVFRDIASDEFQGEYAAKQAYEKFGKRKVAIFNCENDYCKGIANVFKKTFEELGGKIVVMETHNRGANDLRTSLTKIKNSNPDMLFFPSFTAEAILGIRQMNDLGMKDLMVMGPESWSDTAIWSQLGSLGNGKYYTEPVNTDLSDDFTQRMNAKISGKEILVYAGRTYDAVNLLAQAIKGTNNGEQIKNNLYKIKDYKGMADTYTFDQNGDITNHSYVLKKVNNGKAEVVK